MLQIGLSRFSVLAFGILVLGLVPSTVFADKEKLIQVPGKPGIYKKVIVRRNNAKLYSEPGSGQIEDIKPFSIFFKLRTGDGQEEKDGYFCVGDSEGTPIGWLKKDDVFAWDTRFALQPNPPQGAAKFTVIGDNNLKAEYNGGAPKGDQVLCPILEEPLDGTYTVAFFTGKAQTSAGAGVVSQEQFSPQFLEKLQLEIVFVIDTTGSMTPLIEGTKEVAGQIADFVAKNPESGSYARFGLVQYRDLTPDSTFAGKPAELVTPLTDIATFRKGLATLRADGGGDIQEDVLAGVLLAIEHGGWSNNSSKHIIILGDASTHLSGPMNSTGLSIEAMISRAMRTGGSEAERAVSSINFHAVRADQPGTSDDEIECARQFRMFAANGGRFQGYYADFNPNDPVHRTRVINEATNTILNAITAIGTIRAGGTPTPTSSSTSPIEKAIWHIYVAVHGQPIEPVEKRKAKIRSDDGDLLAVQMVMVSEDDLRRLRSTLDLLQVELGGKVEPTKRGDVGKLLHRIKELLLSSVTGQDLDEDTPLEAVITSLPLKTDVLKTTVRELAQKDADGFKKWLEGLEAAKKRAEDLLNRQADEWSTLSEKATNQRFAYILLQDMP